MRNTLLLSILFLFCCCQVSAQQKQFKPDSFQNPFKSKDKKSQPTTIAPKSGLRMGSQKKGGPLNGSAYLRIAEKENLSLADLESKFGLQANMSLKKLSANTDPLGFEHETFQQYYKGLPVEGYVLFKHRNKGTILHGAVAEIKDLDITPAIKVADAQRIARAALGVDKTLRDYPIPLKVIKIPKKDRYAVAYEVRIDASKPFLMKKVYVDAKSGEVLKTLELIPHADTPGTAHTLYSGTQQITMDAFHDTYRLRESGRKIETYDATNAEFTEAGIEGVSDFVNASTTWTVSPYLSSFTISETSGWWVGTTSDSAPDLYITVKDGNDHMVYQSDYLSDTEVPVTFSPNLLLNKGPYVVEIWDYNHDSDNVSGGTYPINWSTTGTTLYSDLKNSGSYQIEELHNPALDVHWGMEVTYDFYKEAFGRDSYDGLGSPIRQYVNPRDLQAQYGNDPNNAFAIGAPYNIMAYGLGDGELLGPVVSIDVEGHEFSHLVIDNNGNGGLNYEGESGALNESFADIFGAGVEFFSGVNPDWLIGEDVMISYPFLRSMSNPKEAGNPDTYKGGYWIDPEDLSNDYGGVHINSGVQNYWFYLLSEGGAGTNDKAETYNVSGIGIEKASQIAYRNLIHYLGPQATFYDAYFGSLQAAEDLYGNPSAEYEAVQNAWFAVNVGYGPELSCVGLVKTAASTGTISDGSGSADYDNNLNCSWLIAPQGATQITLDFTAFDTEPEYDTVFVYDGTTENHEILLEWWGNTLPPQITSSTGALLIRFSSDENTTAAGWSANYTSTLTKPYCDGSTILTEAEGHFEDGSGTDPYANNSRCSWLIAPPCASSITLSFSSFDTEQDTEGLIVYDGNSEESPLLAILSGSELPDDISSSTGEMLVVFITDESITMQGFSASYTSQGTAFCERTNIITDSDNGIISDGSGTENYCNNQQCSWLISPPDAEFITLSFSEFDLEKADEDGTVYDALEIYDGDSENASLIGIYSGNTIPSKIVSSGGAIFLKFYSDMSINHGGWELEYTTGTQTFCAGTQTMTDMEGELHDGSDLKDYGNNSGCSWLIKPEKAASIHLSFTEFDVEQDHDAIIVYDGENASAPVLANLSGHTIPAEISSTSGSMFIEFFSNQKNRRPGWRANYRSQQILGLEDEFFHHIKVYPNPASDYITIENAFGKNIKVVISDMAGHELLKPMSLKSGFNNINTKGLNSGLYFINFMVEGKKFTRKIVVK
jgi:Zn-dependent metalloprotease